MPGKHTEWPSRTARHCCSPSRPSLASTALSQRALAAPSPIPRTTRRPTAEKEEEMTHHRSHTAVIGAMKRALTLTTAALAPTLALVFLVGGHAQNALGAASRTQATETPSATQFAHNFIGVTNKHASEHGN